MILIRQPYKFPPCDHHVVGNYTNCDLQPEYPTPVCSNQCVDGYSGSFFSDLHYGSDAYTVANNESAIMTELYTKGSLEVDFEVYGDFPSYTSGVYSHNYNGTNNTYLGGHAVKLIGWGETLNGTKYWEIVNSWNKDWAMNGTFWMLRGSNECGIEQDANGGTPWVNTDSYLNNLH